MWIIFICLSGTVVTGQSLNSWRDMDGYFETSSETPALEMAAVHLSATDVGATLLDTHVSSENVPNGKIQKFCLWIASSFLFSKI